MTDADQFRIASVKLSWLGIIAGLLTAAPQGWAGRPLTTDDAGTVAPGEFEFEAGAVWHRDSGFDDIEFPFGVTAGLLPTLEAGIGFGSAIQEREEATSTKIISGLGDLALGAKWNPLAEERYWVSHALSFTAKLPTASRSKGIGTGKADFDLTYIASKSLADTLSAHLNVGYTWTGDPASGAEPDILHSGLAVGWFVAPRWELVAEVFADLPDSRADDAVAQINCGLRWSVHERLTLDTAVATKLINDAPDLTATLGLTWAWDIGLRKQAAQP